jgi:hypothetical protein
VLQTTAGKMIFGKFDERSVTMPRTVEHRNDVRKTGATPAAAVSEPVKPE